MDVIEVDPRTKRVFDRLRRVYVFHALRDEQLVEATRLFESEMVEPGAVICEEGKTGLDGTEGDVEAPRWFYVVDKGRVRLSRSGSARTQTLGPGDFFGMEALAAPRAPHPYTLTALDKVTLLRLKKDDFDKLGKDSPFFQQAVQLMVGTRAWLYKQPWTWLAAAENVHLITRRHNLVLLYRELAPGGLLLACLLGALAAYLLQFIIVLWVVLFFASLVGIWMFLVAVDWGNDYYVVTHQRVVYVEKVILIYDSRINLSMSALTNVGTESENVADRLLDYGNVEVKTIAKPMLLQGVPYPPIIAAIIEEQIGRLKQTARENEVKLMREALRNRISPPLSEPHPEKPKPGPKPRESLTRQLSQLFSIQLRYEEGDTIVYRKHWWFLLLNIGWPSVALLFTVGVVGVVLSGLLVPPEPITRAAVALIGLVFFIVLFGWWLYQFQDWRNDLYQVTPTQIVDIYRKPLGRETRDSAELDKVQGLESERPNLVGRLLNFGNVRISIVGKELTFDDVYDPLNVQEDIQRRIESFKARRRELDSRQRREELVDLLSAYYLETQPAQSRNGPT
jgi:CRP-like cAMP-binding protein